jgi:hypothetical protein
MLSSFRLACPDCCGPVRRVSRDPSIGETILWGCGSEIMFWLLFIICLAVGAWSWIAGVVAGAVVGIFYLSWLRTESMYSCTKCNRPWAFLHVRAAWERCNA